MRARIVSESVSHSSIQTVRRAASDWASKRVSERAKFPANLLLDNHSFIVQDLASQRGICMKWILKILFFSLSFSLHLSLFNWRRSFYDIITVSSNSNSHNQLPGCKWFFFFISIQKHFFFNFVIEIQSLLPYNTVVVQLLRFFFLYFPSFFQYCLSVCRSICIFLGVVFLLSFSTV